MFFLGDEHDCEVALKKIYDTLVCKRLQVHKPIHDFHLRHRMLNDAFVQRQL